MRQREYGLQSTSLAHKVLCLLVDVGGEWKIARLRQAVANNTPGAFYLNATSKLESFGYVRADRFNMTVTPAGRAYVEAYRIELRRIEAAKPGAVAMRRDVNVYRSAPMKPMSLLDAGMRREGSLEFRNWPSLMGNERRLPNGDRIE